MSHNILVRFWHFPVMTLGPGKRLGIWLQGCSIRCNGCIAPENQNFDKNFSLPVSVLISDIASVINYSEGVTISGGEPLDQADSLIMLLDCLNNFKQRDILLYSGYLKEKILSDYPVISKKIAALVDGPFISGNITKEHWKGSNNQTLTIFREEYRKKYEHWSKSTEQNLQLIKKDSGIYLIGIPKQEDCLKNKLRRDY